MGLALPSSMQPLVLLYSYFHSIRFSCLFKIIIFLFFCFLSKTLAMNLNGIKYTATPRTSARKGVARCLYGVFFCALEILQKIHSFFYPEFCLISSLLLARRVKCIFKLINVRQNTIIIVNPIQYWRENSAH